MIKKLGIRLISGKVFNFAPLGSETAPSGCRDVVYNIPTSFYLLLGILNPLYTLHLRHQIKHASYNLHEIQKSVFCCCSPNRSKAILSHEATIVVLNQGIESSCVFT